jgi:hypothetical protein
VVHAEKNNGATESRSNSGKKILAGAQDHGEAEKNKSLAACSLTGRENLDTRPKWMKNWNS